MGFSAALGFVVGAVGDAILVDVVLDGGSVSSVRCRGRGGERQDMAYLVAAAVHAKEGGHCDSAAEEEQRVENVERERDRGSRHHSGECACDEEDEG